MPRLLLIDDDETMRKLLRSRLQDSYEIIEAEEPEEGIVFALQQKPDAILLDLMMPRCSGFEVCQTLSSMSFTQGIPIFIVSGESAERYGDFCKNLGARGFFQKPVDFASLRKELAAAVGGTNGRRHTARVRLRTPLKLTGVDARGHKFDVSTITESVTADGFLCSSPADLKRDAVIDVFLAGDGEPFAGKARLVHVHAAEVKLGLCEFRFLELPIGWVLP